MAAELGGTVDVGSGVGDAVAVGVAVSVGGGVDVAVGNGAAVLVGGLVGCDVEVCVGKGNAVAAPSLSWAGCGATAAANVMGSGVAISVDLGIAVYVTATSICGAASWATITGSVDGDRAASDDVVSGESAGATRLARPPHRKRSTIRPRVAPQPVRERLDQVVGGLDGFLVS